MFANNQNEVMNYNVILNKKNYNVWLSRLEVSLTSMNLKEFIKNDVIEQLKKKNPNDKARIKEAIMQDSKAQMVIFNTINIETHNSIRNLKTAYDILRKLKEKYEEDLNESMEQWMSKLRLLKARNKKEVFNILNEIEEIYSNMEENNLNLSKEEKMIFIYNAMPSCTQMKIVIDNGTTVDSLIKKIREFTKYEIYMEDSSHIRRIESKQDTRPDDPMDIDSITRKYKGINNQKQRVITKENTFIIKKKLEDVLYAIQLSILKRTVNIIFLIKRVNIINF
ncbi:hypothetical protein H8356DRAFT_1376298 [Neocallimastix lanati (nom. inval.)]|nr:hypothetical protein H8356DRAFT_1376298 [Neocallimastix sp. JGI-2020a]